MKIKTHPEYTPILEGLNHPWHYGNEIWGEKWVDWTPNILPFDFLLYHKTN